MDQIHNKISQQLKEIKNKSYKYVTTNEKLKTDKKKIDIFSEELSTLKEEIQIEKQILDSKNYEFEENRNSLELLKKEKEHLDLSIVNLERKDKTLKKTKPSTKDQLILERGERRHKLFKEFTCVRWDYSTPDDTYEGYITNKKDFLQKISYQDNINLKTLKELLWKDIQKCALHPNSIDKEQGKENFITNQ